MIRYALSRRWLAWHLLWAVAMVVCLRLAIWQWSVASAPHVPGAPVQVWRNYAYAVNWLIFAAVGAWFWWRFMRDQRAAEAARAAEPDADADREFEANGASGRRRFDPFAPEAPQPTEAARTDRASDG